MKKKVWNGIIIGNIKTWWWNGIIIRNILFYEMAKMELLLNDIDLHTNHKRIWDIMVKIKCLVLNYLWIYLQSYYHQN